MKNDNMRGIIIISLLLFTYILFFSPFDQGDSGQTNKNDSTEQVSVKAASQWQTPKVSVAFDANDTTNHIRFGGFANGLKGQASNISIENKELKLEFTSKGAQFTKVILKNHASYQEQNSPLVLMDDSTSKMSALLDTKFGNFELYDFYYTAIKNNEKSVSFKMSLDSSSYIMQTYTLKDEGFVVDYKVDFINMESVLNRKDLLYTWHGKMKNIEKDVSQSRYRTNINFGYESGDYDYVSLATSGPSSYEPELPIRWMSFKQKFFTAAFICKQNLDKPALQTLTDAAQTKIIKEGVAKFTIPGTVTNATEAQMQFYFGPNDYDICATVAPGFERNVDLGWSLFVPISLYIIMPLFSLLQMMTSSYGLIIILMVLVIKTLLLPLTYKSYLSMAKMRVLKPEIEEINKKHPGDMQARQQEMMKLYSQMGVNPLSGCIPVLVQMPVLLAMFNFFPNALELRQQSFLWAEDLSSYDSIWDFGFNVPFVGDHISLFTVLMTISTLGYTYMMNQMTVQQPGPMKYMGYVVPVLFMFFLNDYAAALTFYYLVSNLVTMGQQVVIRRFVDDSKIRQSMEQNKVKNKDKKAMGFRARLEAAMKQQQELAKKKQEEMDKKKNDKNDKK